MDSYGLQRLMNDKTICTDFTVEKLRNELNQELSKPLSEQDFDLMQELNTYLIEISNKIDETDVNVEDSLAAVTRRLKGRKRKKSHLPRYAIAACLTAVVLLSSNYFTISAYGMNLFSAIVEFSKEAIKFDFRGQQDESSISLSSTTDDPYGLRTECEKRGITSPLVPTFLPEGYTLQKLEDVSSAGYSKGLCFYYKNKEKLIDVNMIEYQLNLPDNFGFPNNNGQLEQLEINNRATFVLHENDRYSAAFSDGLTVYTLHAKKVDYEMIIKILKSYQ